MPAYPTVFAAVYNPVMASGEWGGMRKLRRSLLAQASGKVVEVGAGTGLNLALYPKNVTDLTLTEPDDAMFAKLTKVAGASPVQPHVVRTGAENLPFADGSVDTVVSTMVLCTVPNLSASLTEIRRVLGPGGRLLLIEHVRSAGRLGRVQDRITGRGRRSPAGATATWTRSGCWGRPVSTLRPCSPPRGS